MKSKCYKRNTTLDQGTITATINEENREVDEVSGVWPLSAQILNDLLETADIGIWSYHFKTHKLNLCPIASGVVRLRGSLDISFHNLMRRVTGDQRISVFKAVKLTLKLNGKFTEEFLLDNDNYCTWVRVTGKVYYRDNIPEIFTGTVTDITERKKKEIWRNDLLAFINHELRTPLTTIKLYVQSGIKNISKKDYIVKDMLQRADIQVVFMSKLIDNFLTLSLVENARLNIKPVLFNLYKLIVEVINDMKLLNPNYDFKIDSQSPLWVTADEDKIRQVLSNFVSNAIKFSPDNQRIVLKCNKLEKQIMVAVQDNGIGILKADQKRLFNRYERVGKNCAHQPKGYGLGLYLSKEIIEQHNGKVWLESISGLGSTFHFSFPEVPVTGRNLKPVL